MNSEINQARHGPAKMDCIVFMNSENDQTIELIEHIII